MCCQMNRRFGFPVLVYVIAKLFDFLGNLVRADGLMFAASDFNAGRTKVSRIGADSIESDAV